MRISVKDISKPNGNKNQIIQISLNNQRANKGVTKLTTLKLLICYSIDHLTILMGLG